MTELFAVHDAAADCFIDPFPAPTLEVALRGFRQACEKEGHEFQKFPTDYSLWHVGSFDAALGEIHGQKAVKIAMATTFGGLNAVPGRKFDGEYPDREVS